MYAQGDQIDHLMLFELYGWKCWLCTEPINRNIRKPNYLAGTVDHVVPLCTGGTHTWDNVMPAHAICNFTKGDTVTVQHVDNGLTMW